ncbi:hypothetical protein D9M72_596570 [compost metagenome]
MSPGIRQPVRQLYSEMILWHSPLKRLDSLQHIAGSVVAPSIAQSLKPHLFEGSLLTQDMAEQRQAR